MCAFQPSNCHMSCLPSTKRIIGILPVSVSIKESRILLSIDTHLPPSATSAVMQQSIQALPPLVRQLRKPLNLASLQLRHPHSLPPLSHYLSPAPPPHH